MKKKDNQHGFTLVELIIVMAILAVLAGIAVPKYGSILAQSKFKAHDTNVEMITNAAEMYWADKGKKLDNIGELQTAGYIDTAKLEDTPYNTSDTEIAYTCEIVITDGVATLTVHPGKSKNENGILKTPVDDYTKILN